MLKKQTFKTLVGSSFINMDSRRWQVSLWTAYVLSIITLLCPRTQGAKILVVPVDGSHWINMKIIIEELKLQGHDISVLYTATTWYIKEKPDLYESILVKLQHDFGESSHHVAMEILVQNTLKYLESSWTIVRNFMFQKLMSDIIFNSHILYEEFNVAIFENQTLLNQLKNSNFDLVLTDPVFATGPMLSHYLKVPLVYNIRWHLNGEAHFLSAPSPPSFIPVPGSQFTDKMNFFQRTLNLMVNLYQQVVTEMFIYPMYNEVCHRYLGPDTDIQTILQRADVWLIRVDFIFEFPRPTMPNIVYIGGFQCKPAKPLAAELEIFVQSSGEHGLIVMSLGSIINSLPMQITMEIAEAFAQVPQKVIWKYNGVAPPHLGNNTLLVKWIPQNDLLGHPKTRAFVAHGGTNGIYEAIYHGVPVIGMPLIFDQFDNLVRLESRGAAKVINVATMHSSDLVQALNEVINNTFYRDNMKKLSALHQDQPESPMERAIFWIEYVARHKGAGHLRSESYRLPWYAYHCVDVMILLLFILLLVTVFVGVTLKKLCRAVLKKKQKSE
ncbi:UDP-glucuronosyltransferase 2C1-like isoform X2 [Narcine bancroftii]|uniref:UDP-glucuronosyltransferase 2C1-like isoform X2 n=1 Tax=Narcine bancroftii TaxID=1343680 RepID=UPI003831E08C